MREGWEWLDISKVERDGIIEKRQVGKIEIVVFSDTHVSFIFVQKLCQLSGKWEGEYSVLKSRSKLEPNKVIRTA